MEQALSTDLLALQREQHAHDLRSHSDILALPLPQRVSHMVLHFAKYVGRVLRDDVTVKDFENTVVDTFIICLATANALSVNLARESAEVTNTSAFNSEDTITAQEFGSSLAVITGRMAKACEALDHIEKFDSRGHLEAGVVAISALCQRVAECRSYQLDQLARLKWRAIEVKQALRISN